ncbi:hypothetical protein K438DRAFT_1963230 [Mycena galopus ATCC 62051]|nr:hypothetical protein K438DRAFT_1963230 [Mycena galopus ATCC 62051]
MSSISRASAVGLLNSWPLPRSQSALHQRSLQISVLDSSFNPPTLAHLALDNAPRPSSGDDAGRGYDAEVCLLSVRNADKTLKPTDASYIQRLEMMRLLAQDSAPDPEAHQIAIGIVDEPTFGKATKLLAFLEQRLSGLPRPQLTFLLGLDTLERVLAPVAIAQHDNARIVCARRASSSSSEAATLKLGERFVSDERIIRGAVQSYSSTAVLDALIRRDDVSWRALVSPRVREYTSKSKLYMDPAVMVE